MFTFRTAALLLLTVFALSCSEDDTSIVDNDDVVTDCSNVSSVFTIALSTDGCTTDIASELNTTSLYNENVQGNTRTISINSIPDHMVGTFPNQGNPNTISEQSKSFTMTTAPQAAASVTNGQGWVGGVLFSGVTIEVYTAEFFGGSNGQTNSNWKLTTLQSVRSLGLDCNNAHVQPTGSYHYHGLPNAYGSDLNINGSQMVRVGYAADGFPIYYSYIEDDNGNIITASASYELRTGDRGGDGISAPDGCYDGRYFQDYEYVAASGDLDECNGRFGTTPENSAGEYYYVLTEDFPSAPLCFAGTPDNSFSLRP